MSTYLYSKFFNIKIVSNLFYHILYISLCLFWNLIQFKSKRFQQRFFLILEKKAWRSSFIVDENIYFFFITYEQPTYSWPCRKDWSDLVHFHMYEIKNIFALPIKVFILFCLARNWIFCYQMTSNDLKLTYIVFIEVQVN